MRRSLLSLFVIIALLVPNFAVAEAAPPSREEAYSHIKIHNDGLSKIQFIRCERRVKQAFKMVPENHLAPLKDLVLHKNDELRRGLAGANIIYINCLPNRQEFTAVFIHELGHVVDLGLLTGEDDPSDSFYNISWHDHHEHELHDHADSEGFVSGYGSTNQFEDFAEAYAFYVLYGEEFRHFAETNETISRKYRFMRNVVFADREFKLENNPTLLTSGSPFVKIGARFDVTRLHYSQK